jgi:hypothetical protein
MKYAHREFELKLKAELTNDDVSKVRGVFVHAHNKVSGKSACGIDVLDIGVSLGEWVTKFLKKRGASYRAGSNLIKYEFPTVEFTFETCDARSTNTIISMYLTYDEMERDLPNIKRIING